MSSSKPAPSVAAVLSVLSVLSLGTFFAARADQVVLEPSKDNTLYEDPTGISSNGVGPHVYSGNNSGGDTRRAVLAFDVAGFVPAGSTVTGVSLRLTVSRSAAGSGSPSVQLRRLTGDWGEAGSDAGEPGGTGSGALPGDATWIHRFFDTVFWNTAGGDYSATVSASANVGGVGATPTWGSTAQMVADVQGWVDDPATSFGWIVIGNEAANQTAKRFHSREGLTPSQRPKLTIDFTPPAAGGACCLGGGICSTLTAAQCASQSGTYEGDGTSCTPNPCPQPLGACCFPAGTCSELTLDDCMAQSGTYNGADTTCVMTDCEVVLTPYVDALPIPVPATPVTGVPGGEATYRLAITEFDQQLHRDLPATRVWGYGGSFPGPTIEAWADQQVTVEWVNDLRDELGDLRTEHLLPVDLCPHGPDTAGPSARTVVHLHGGHVPEAFDGYPEWTQLPGEETTYVYPNQQLPGTLWYHDHALGITRLNVYLGLAGFYLLRDATEQALGLPSGAHEIPLAIQDRKVLADGSFDYPALWQENFFGDKTLVNGKIWPYLDVDRGKYRFRVLSGSGSRHYRLALSDGASLQVIGTEGGLLPAPVTVTQLLLGPGERADIVMDFEPYAPGTEIVLMNDAPAPYPGSPGVGVVPNVMKFVVQSQVGHTAPIPASLRAIEVLDENDATVFRDFELQKTSDPCTGSMWTINGLHWDHITEFPELGETEVWSFINRSGMTHPMHMHLVSFQVLDRQTFTLVDGEVTPTGPRIPPPAEEAGWKDTALVDPFVITRVIARFEDYKGRFAYHCHILEHEDHEMMRQFETVSCGDSEIDATESCDDGNLASGDACSGGCDVEYFVDLDGLAQGGSVEVKIGGMVVTVTTTAGQAAEQVAQAVADAINAETGISATAQAEGGRVVLDAEIERLAVTDVGLRDLLTLRLGRGLLWWASVEDAASYDIVRGDLGALRSTGGDFASATTMCVDDDRMTTLLGEASVPAPDDGSWYLVRETTPSGAGTYDSAGTGQAESRDAEITASGVDCAPGSGP